MARDQNLNPQARLKAAYLSRSAIVVPSTKSLANSLLDIAAFIAETTLVRGADSLASPSDAGRAEAALPVLRARLRRSSNAGYLGGGVWNEALAAGAAGAVVGDGAQGVGSAGRFGAGVGASVVNAGLCRAAVLVGVATQDALVAYADVAEEAVVVNAAGEDAVALEALLVERAIVVDGAPRKANVVLAHLTVGALLIRRTRQGHCDNDTITIILKTSLTNILPRTHSISSFPVNPAGQLQCRSC